MRRGVCFFHALSSGAGQLAGARKVAQQLAHRPDQRRNIPGSGQAHRALWARDILHAAHRRGDYRDLRRHAFENDVRHFFGERRIDQQVEPWDQCSQVGVESSKGDLRRQVQRLRFLLQRAPQRSVTKHHESQTSGLFAKLRRRFHEIGHALFRTQAAGRGDHHRIAGKRKPLQQLGSSADMPVGIVRRDVDGVRNDANLVAKHRLRAELFCLRRRQAHRAIRESQREAVRGFVHFHLEIFAGPAPQKTRDPHARAASGDDPQNVRLVSVSAENVDLPLTQGLLQRFQRRARIHRIGDYRNAVGFGRLPKLGAFAAALERRNADLK